MPMSIHTELNKLIDRLIDRKLIFYFNDQIIVEAITSTNVLHVFIRVRLSACLAVGFSSKQLTK